jgi:hypothetical protein
MDMFKKGVFFVIVIAVSGWKKKLALLVSVLLLIVLFSIVYNYYKASSASVELEDVFENPIVQEELQPVEVDPDEIEMVIDQDENECDDPSCNEQTNEENDSDKENEESGEIEEFGNETEIKKSFFEKLIEKFSK